MSLYNSVIDPDTTYKCSVKMHISSRGYSTGPDLKKTRTLEVSGVLSCIWSGASEQVVFTNLAVRVGA